MRKNRPSSDVINEGAIMKQKQFIRTHPLRLLVFVKGLLNQNMSKFRGKSGYVSK